MKMIDIKFAGSIPDSIREKAYEIVKEFALQIGNGWKKVQGLKNHFSFRLRDGFRILLGRNGHCYVYSHQKYEKRIRILKKEMR